MVITSLSEELFYMLTAQWKMCLMHFRSFAIHPRPLRDVPLCPTVGLGSQKQHNLNAIANAETREFLHKFPRESQKAQKKSRHTHPFNFRSST